MSMKFNWNSFFLHTIVSFIASFVSAGAISFASSRDWKQAMTAGLGAGALMVAGVAKAFSTPPNVVTDSSGLPIANLPPQVEVKQATSAATGQIIPTQRETLPEAPLPLTLFPQTIVDPTTPGLSSQNSVEATTPAVVIMQKDPTS